MKKSSLEIEWLYEEQEWVGLKQGSKKLSQVIEGRIQHAIQTGVFSPEPQGEICILLADDYKLKELNHQFRQKDKATNVLSFPSADFPAQEGDNITSLGDIALGYETIEDEAFERKISIIDHTTHLIVHGILHLMGYDHENDTDAMVMENLEKKIMKGMSLHDPYPEINDQ